MTEPQFNRRPTTFAEKMGAGGEPCPIPATHDRLFEVHYWWHEMAEMYHEPDPFRWRLGAFAQAARSVSFMLQTEKAAFKDFDWYEIDWVGKMKADSVMRWLDSTRTSFFHRSNLAPTSWMQMECFRNPRESVFDEDKLGPIGTYDPFQCTHTMMHGPETDHGHNFKRQWSMDGLNGQELLDACGHVYDRLDELVTEAHNRLGSQVVTYFKVDSKRRLPCMENVDQYRVLKTRIRRGKEVWINKPKKPHL